MIIRRLAMPLLTVALVTISSGCGTTTHPVAGDGPLPSPVEEVQGRWWTWASSEPEKTNPVADPTGRFCDRNQPDDVWFLAGTFGGTVTRTCAVPAGRPIVVPLVNLVGDRVSCASFMASAEGSAVLDGNAVTPERLESDGVSVTGVEGNPLTGTSGSQDYHACGLWVRLPPLAPGEHTLVLRGASEDFTTGVDYTLAVTAAPRA
ncbi:signal protein [Planomonospora corallina]|uniref:Signal protein n=1 Tax=Planomonospora corallina TaxID=1806052 RepID=A0ABV8HYJ3_9ACTN